MPKRHLRNRITKDLDFDTKQITKSMRPAKRRKSHDTPLVTACHEHSGGGRYLEWKWLRRLAWIYDVIRRRFTMQLVAQAHTALRHETPPLGIGTSGQVRQIIAACTTERMAVYRRAVSDISRWCACGDHRLISQIPLG
ncbi:MAG TPA: hypothetical protein PLY87_09040 [Planctomycetaceae bacterium]|nr:hypothetical protein [Planctomycetaceae bacterium]HQZ65208.1 hypothetical protein [Planctomycetaceae bacterium]